MDYAQYITFAEVFGWYPSQVDEEDAEVIDAMTVYLRAKGDHAAQIAKIEERKRNRGN